MKYARTDNLDVVAAFSNCHGTFNAVSFVADWQLARQFDSHARLIFSQVAGGLANRPLHRNSINPSAGFLFRF
jgi:hypothetical protein